MSERTLPHWNVLVVGDGPYRDRPSFDFIAQAMSGFMSVNGAEGEAPAEPKRV